MNLVPLPAATTTLTNAAITSQPVFEAFQNPMYMEIGLIIAALAVLFIIGLITHVFDVLRGHGFYTRDVITGHPKYQKFQ